MVALAFHPGDGSWVTASSSGLLQRWTRDGQAAGEIALPGTRWMDVALSPDGTQVAALSRSTLYLWRFADLAGSRAQGRTELGIEDASCKSVAYRADGRQLALACADQSVRLFDPRAGRLLRVLAAHGDEVSDVAFSPDGTRLATASADRTFAVLPLAFPELYALARRLQAASSGAGNVIDDPQPDSGG
jgi:WD40 repeat protein